VWFLIFLVIPFALVILVLLLIIWAIHNKVLGAPAIAASSLFLVGKLPLCKLVTLLKDRNGEPERGGVNGSR
jgi:hypothetical protein